MGNGALELLKWVALVLMTGDHIDAAFFDRTFWILTEAGRVAMPIFACVFGYNLVRIGNDQGKLAALRNKLLVVGLIAYPFHCFAVAHSWVALNILFAFAVAVQIQIWICQDRRKNLAPILILFCSSGLLLEFAWVAPALVLAWCWFWRGPGLRPVVALVATYMALCVVNQNYWALGSLPLIFLAAAADPQIPRVRQAFWIYYPGHLVILTVLLLSPAPYMPLVSVPAVDWVGG